MRGRDYILLLISVILLVLSFPRFDFEFLAWLALVPWFIAIEDKSVKEAGRFSFFLGFIFWLGVLFWLRLVTTLGLTLLVIYLSLYFSLWGWGIKFIQRKLNFSLVFISPILWVSLEYLRGRLFTGFPWLPLGNSQYLNLPLIQFTEFSGVYGLSFLIVAVNAALAEIFIQINPAPFCKILNLGRREKVIKPAWVAGGKVLKRGGVKNKWISPLIVGIFFFIIFLSGKKVLKEGESLGTFSVAVIQGNISGEVKWLPEYEDDNRKIYQILTEEVASNRPDLIIWPETAVTVSLPQDLEWHHTLSFLAETSKSFLLVGSPYYSEESGEYFNSAFLISPQGRLLFRYDKLHLVPFGEYVPKENYFPDFFDRIFQEVGNYTQGKERTIFSIPQGNFSVLICFENIFPDLVRQFVKAGSELLINITNDVWFGKSSAPFQHMAMGVLRAVENRRYLICCANTGISAFISPEGRILGQVEDKLGQSLWVRGFLVEKVGFQDKLTFYTRYGDWFAWLNLLGSGVLLTMGSITTFKQRRIFHN